MTDRDYGCLDSATSRRDSNVQAYATKSFNPKPKATADAPADFPLGHRVKPTFMDAQELVPAGTARLA